MQSRFDSLSNPDLYKRFVLLPTPTLLATIFDRLNSYGFSQWVNRCLILKKRENEIYLLDAMQKLSEVDTLIMRMNPDLIDEEQDTKIINLLSAAGSTLAQFPFQESPHAFVFWQLAGTIFRHLCFMPNHVQNSGQLTELLYKIARFMPSRVHDSLMSINNERAHSCFLNSLRENPDNPVVWFLLSRTLAYYEGEALFLPDDEGIFGNEINTLKAKIAFAEAKSNPQVEQPFDASQITFPIAINQPPQIPHSQIIEHRVYCMVETQASNFIPSQNSEEYTNFVHNDWVEDNPQQPCQFNIAGQRNRLFHPNPNAGGQTNITVNFNFPPPGM